MHESLIIGSLACRLTPRSGHVWDVSVSFSGWADRLDLGLLGIRRRAPELFAAVFRSRGARGSSLCSVKVGVLTSRVSHLVGFWSRSRCFSCPNWRAKENLMHPQPGHPKALP